MPSIEKNTKHSIEIIIDYINIDKKKNDRLVNSLEIATKIGKGQIIINDGSQDILYSQNYACKVCDISYEILEPTNFSFNSPHGACPKCDGLGTQTELDIDKIIPDSKKSLIEGAIAPVGDQVTGSKGIGKIIKSLSLQYNFSYTTSWGKLPEDVKHILINGVKNKHTKSYYSLENFEGIIPNLKYSAITK